MLEEIRIKKWQQDGPFCRFLVKKEYARYNKKGAVSLIISEGLAIYMWESWKGGADEQRRELIQSDD